VAAVVEKNRLYYGDNLDVLRTHVKDQTVDLVYLDPPFNSNRNYNVIFGKHLRQANDAAQIEAFGDTWVWTPVTDEQYRDLVNGGLPSEVSNALAAMRTLLTENDAMAYLVNMAPRLVELHRVLKTTGSLYLHCDPTMSHFLKILLDTIFGPEQFKSEIIWKRTGSHGSAKRYGPVHDVILFYSKSNVYTWNQVYGPYDPDYISEKFGKSDERGNFQDISLTGPEVRAGDSGKPWRGVDPTVSGRHWALPGFLSDLGILPPAGSVQERLDALDAAGRIYWTSKGTPRLKFYVEDGKGMPLADVWTDIGAINSQAAERLGYPTQKPIALMERIVSASSNEGDVVLDPFCGCGTTIDAAQRLNRQWTGIDVTYISIDLIQKRLKDRFGEAVDDTYVVAGIPRDKAAALALFSKSPFDFERWAVSLVGGQPNQKQVGDRGVDGVARFPLGDPNRQSRQIGQILISVKGGKSIGPAFVRDLLGTVNTQNAELGLLVTMAEPTRGILDAVNHAGTYRHPSNGEIYPKVQVITVSDLLAGKSPKLPPTMLPYVRATRSTFNDDSLF
jgi:DNA modification methylase